MQTLIATLIPRCLWRETPWCYCETLSDYLACFRLFFERSLYWSPFGPQSVILEDTISLLQYFVEMTRFGMLSDSSQPGILSQTLRQREYIDFFIWERENMPISTFVDKLKRCGFLVYVDCEHQEPISLTEAKRLRAGGNIDVRYDWKCFLAGKTITPNNKYAVI